MMGEIEKTPYRNLPSLIFFLILISGFGGAIIYSFAASPDPAITPTLITIQNANITNSLMAGSANAKEGFATLLWDVSGNHWETAKYYVEYHSSNQHGGIYGVVYRTYFNSSLPSYLTQGTPVSKLVDYTCYFSDEFRWAGCGHASWGKPSELYYIRLSGVSRAGNLSLSVSHSSLIIDGWVDYTKS